MNNIAIKIEQLSKLYKLGEFGTGTISHDLNRWWAKFRGKPDPFASVGSINNRSIGATKHEYTWALKNVEFEVRKGEVIGIIGKNGAGKSTLLKLLSRVTAPTEGSIKANGRIASLLEVGTGMHPELTGRENVYLNGTILGMQKREITKKFNDIIEFAGCAKYVDTPVKRYSSGMKVRLGFAVAAFLEPEILIVDEVLAVGDAEFQKKAIGKIQEVSQSESRTVLFVSHNMQTVASLCTRGILLDNGMVSFTGSTADTIRKYVSIDETNGEQLNFQRRTGSGEVQISGLEILDSSENSIHSAMTGQTIIIRIHYEIHNDSVLTMGLRFGLKISDAMNLPLIWHQSRYVGQDFSKEKLMTNTFCDLVINEIPFSESTYKLSPSIFIDHQFIDNVENITTLNIIPGKIYNYVENPSYEKSRFYIKGDWRIG